MTFRKQNLWFGFFIAACWLVSLGAKERGKPNIVIILTDDLGYGDVSFLNAESKVKTPHMDKLAEEGVWATDAHSPSTVCSPSGTPCLPGGIHGAERLAGSTHGKNPSSHLTG